MGLIRRAWNSGFVTYYRLWCSRAFRGPLGLLALTAAEAAGYSSKSAAVTGWRLLRNAKIAHAIASAQRAVAERAELSREHVIRRLIEIQAGARDHVALRAIELLGKELGMFRDLVVMRDPADMTTEELVARPNA